MVKKCVICNNNIQEEYNKLLGTMLKVKNEKGKNEFIHVCSECQKQDKWIETAKIKAA